MIIQLTKGYVTEVSKKDYVYLIRFKWNARNCRGRIYACRNVRLGKKKFKTIYMHREIMQPLPTMEIDHVDGNSLNNKRNNLEIVTRQENMYRIYRKQETKKEPAPF